MADGIVIIPTYNEIENIERLLRNVFSLQRRFHILVVDDNRDSAESLAMLLRFGGDSTDLQVANLTFAGSITTTPEPGTVIRLGKPGSPCFTVLSVDPGRSRVMISADPATAAPVPTPVMM